MKRTMCLCVNLMKIQSGADLDQDISADIANIYYNIYYI